MNEWICNINAQMANNLIKWWRTKFLNGYKPFSVGFSDSRVSDTEELLGKFSEDESSCRLKPPSSKNFHTEQNQQPTPQQNSTTQQNEVPHHHLNLEEFSCNVSVEGGLDKSGQERQEFSFTLYDFDGHGKITKDDIAGLVTTIYEALGTTVKVPHCGSKTIRVKLTVSPDQRKHVSATVINQQEQKTEEKSNNEKVRYKRDLNVTIHQRSGEKRKTCRKQHKDRGPQKHTCGYHKEDPDEVYASDDNSDACSRISGHISSEEEEEEEDEEEWKCSDNQHFKCNKIKQKKNCFTTNTQYTIPNLLIKDPSVINYQYNCAKTKKAKKRSSSLQRQELLEIIQANMDKNNLGFQTVGKPNANYTDSPNKQSPINERKYKHHTRVQKTTSSPLYYLTNMVNPTHFYVDLAALQNTANLSQTNCRYDKLIDAVMCVSNKKVPFNKHQDCHHHHQHQQQQQQQQPQQQQQNTQPFNNNVQNVPNGRTKKVIHKVNDCEKTPVTKKNVKKIPQIVLGHTSSPHHLRHRNRQEDQARAMAQVVHWLEQEFSSNANINEKEDCKTNKQDKPSGSAPTMQQDNSGVERHEHHHVHEHIHHHYHHYQETPVVV